MTSTTADSTAPHSRKLTSRWKALLLLVVVFFLGAASGIGVGGLWLKKHVQAVLADPDSTSGPAIRIFEGMETKLSGKLELTPAESSAMHEEFERATEEIQAVRTETLESIREISRQTLDRIEQHLPTEKRSEFREEARESLVPWSLLPK